MELKSHPLILFMDIHTLPTKVVIDETEYTFDADYRNILYMFEALSDPDLLEEERIIVALNLFYDDVSSIPENKIEEATIDMFKFVTMGDYDPNDNKPKKQEKPLYDWGQDFNIIVAPVNKVLNTDVRGLEFLHWWTFLSAFYEIGECTFNTYVGIRDKLNKGKKLEKYEKTLYNEHRDKIVLKKKVDSVTQSLMDEIMGV